MSSACILIFSLGCLAADLAAVSLREYDFGMSMTLEQLAEQALRLPAASRAQLAEQLVESLADTEADDVRRAWAAEAIRRRDELRSGRVQPVPGEQVLAEVRRVVGR
jgi:putative addiction module component (TIGR02574 family)